MNWPRAEVSRQQHAAQHVADGAKRAFGWFVEERGNLDLVTRDEQEAFSALRQPAQFATVMACFGYGISVVPEQGADPVQQGSASGRNPRNIFKQYEFRWVVFERGKSEHHATQCQVVQSLVFVRQASAF
jgi:hypothetical protein